MCVCVCDEANTDTKEQDERTKFSCPVIITIKLSDLKCHPSYTIDTIRSLVQVVVQCSVRIQCSRTWQYNSECLCSFRLHVKDILPTGFDAVTLPSNDNDTKRTRTKKNQRSQKPTTTVPIGDNSYMKTRQATTRETQD